jgi:putative tryptophan/tyrosine transport system substrate-binding protein
VVAGAEVQKRGEAPVLDIRRRQFITLLGGAAAWPLAARAQQPAMPEIGVLSSHSSSDWGPFVAAFKQGLNETGYIDGQNVSIEYRWAEGHYDRLSALAADLVRRQVAVIAAIGGVNSALAAKAATSELPIVFLTGRDPVELGFVKSFNRPGGNLTGINLQNAELESKRLELLREFVPNASTIAILINPDNQNHRSRVNAMQAAVRAGGQQVVVVGAAAPSDLEPAFAALAQRGANALIVSPDPFLDSHRETLVSLTARYAVPAIFQWREFVQAGGLVSYGSSLTDAHRQQGVYAGKILNGAKPTDLPVVQPTKFEMFLNLKTAKALGLDVPPTLLARADEVIE